MNSNRRKKPRTRHTAANKVYSRVRGRTTTNRQPIGLLDSKQIHNILQSEAHGRHQIGLDLKPITRKRALEKPHLSKLDLDDRKRFVELILALDSDKTILIGCDETPISCRGIGHTHVSALKGFTVYTDKAVDSRFSKM